MVRLQHSGQQQHPEGQQWGEQQQQEQRQDQQLAGLVYAARPQQQLQQQQLQQRQQQIPQQQRNQSPAGVISVLWVPGVVTLLPGYATTGVVQHNMDQVQMT
jgi:hypothetical protein